MYTAYAAWIAAFLLAFGSAGVALAPRSKNTETRVTVIAICLGIPVSFIAYLFYVLYRIAEMDGHS